MAENAPTSETLADAACEFGRFATAVESALWTFAKTMPQNPHEYALRKKWSSDLPITFDEAVAYIYANGYIDVFRGREYRAVNVNGRKYWCMGAPISETILINRKVATVDGNPYEGCAYDQIADQYDDLFETDEARAENAEVARRIERAMDDETRVLDAGCGTGLLLDIVNIPPGRYFGIDPSKAMLAKASARWPAHPFAAMKFEEIWPRKTIGLLVSLFGSASYISPEAVAKVPLICDRWLLMFYADDYTPVTHTEVGIDPEYWPASAYKIPGERVRLGGFVIVEGQR